MNTTCRPWSRKCSANAAATNAPLTRSTGDWSEVTATTTDRSMPSSPRSRSTNSRTSRPRSPIRAITLTSAETSRAIMPRAVDLPTPAPEKMPSRCPRPQVSRPSMARMPSSRGSAMRARCSGGKASFHTGIARSGSTGGPPSMGRARPSTTRPSRSLPTGMRNDVPRISRGAPWNTPAISPYGMTSTERPRNPTTSPISGSSLPSASTEQRLPSTAPGALPSITVPTTSDTVPARRNRGSDRIRPATPCRGRVSTGLMGCPPRRHRCRAAGRPRRRAATAAP